MPNLKVLAKFWLKESLSSCSTVLTKFVNSPGVSTPWFRIFISWLVLRKISFQRVPHGANLSADALASADHLYMSPHVWIHSLLPAAKSDCLFDLVGQGGLWQWFCLVVFPFRGVRWNILMWPGHLQKAKFEMNGHANL